ncbi:tyrosine-protein kinase RYK isoform X1 [Dendropsophus ebraccatus]|uniref:tyrosine-protein kinase RYK isoform X1 n=1 Tax=Dendropsophus ebraccatus TaxID=150705 RepID=UPI003831BC58
MRLVDCSLREGDRARQGRVWCRRCGVIGGGGAGSEYGDGPGRPFPSARPVRDMLPGAPDPPGWWRRRWGRQPGPGLWCPSLLVLLALLLGAGEAQSGPGSSGEPGLNVYMSEEEVRRLIGLDAELYYVRNDIVNHYALSFNLLVPTETSSLHFSWHSKSKVEYKLGFQVDNPLAMDVPQTNISLQGDVPRSLSVFRVDLFCSGKMDVEVILVMQLNITISSAKNITVLNFKRRKMCYRKIEPEVKPPISVDKNSTRIHFDPVNVAPTTSTRVFYISVGVCCAVIFLVAIILAVLHLHSMKRVELDDSMSDSGSSQGLSQPSTQTTQYLRADTPNNATPVTNATGEHGSSGAGTTRNLNGYPTLRIEKNDLKSVTLQEAKAKVKDIAISRERVTLKDVLQEGTFGRIFHGILVDDKDPSKEKPVFVKTVKDQASEAQITMMLTESCKLRGLHHRNLLPIGHVCIEDGEKPMVLLPFMNWGNLKLFLRQCKLVEANNPQAISQQDLVHMAIQIACGMSYLARREVIHKDLAARNCVIDESLQVKITDNALSRDLFPMDYHCLGDNENRPVRWMSLESLVNKEFSSAGDVWAFGVTLWELMTLGQTPYVDIDPFEMAAYLKDGYRIAQPINCPDELFAVMACCWALDPEERPKFQQLVQCLTEFHSALGAYV